MNQLLHVKYVHVINDIVYIHVPLYKNVTQIIMLYKSVSSELLICAVTESRCLLIN